jgi:hypothetical protein
MRNPRVMTTRCDRKSANLVDGHHGSSAIRIEPEAGAREIAAPNLH